MKRILIAELLVLTGCLSMVMTGCTTMARNMGMNGQGVTVSNNIGTSPQIGPATETITIAGVQIPQFSTVKLKGPIAAGTTMMITYNGNYPCQPGGCTVALQLPQSCYVMNGNLMINGILTYNAMQGYFVRNLNCTVQHKSR